MREDLPSPILSAATSQSYDPERWTVVGQMREHRVQGRESLLEIARDHGLGYREVTRINPELDPFLPGDGAPVMLPTARVLPQTPYEHGMVLNLPEKRLYYFYTLTNDRLVISFPVGIGTADRGTPLGDFTITRKLTDPSWTVPPSVREQRPHLPAIIPPGPNNPMGAYALQLSGGSYFIHGTNRPWSIGRRATLGCARLYPEDIPVLFRMAAIGTPMKIIHQPVKIGRQDEQIFLEIHHDRYDGKNWRDYWQEAEQMLSKKGWLNQVESGKVAEVARQGRGIPVPIGRLAK
ncbi:L,D-transpeptidase [Desulfurivibrio dismutans]|uniref:L,D-transpeptidase n=1 Tax=Desulfurivibrio dismutans TaxID=1398908 RepID=UPI0023DC005A|nr:L,D-transpeptidase family protein [Desulfurivibrio alkaliphilus]MDF1615513.1 L,D-transpeptidase family protein [Desulfurivibrio alkaliphilus]